LIVLACQLPCLICNSAAENDLIRLPPGQISGIFFAMPWRQKPADWLRYWTGPINRTAGFKTMLVYCVGPDAEHSDGSYKACHHNSRLRFDDLPDLDWQDISAHLKCTKCGTVGYVDTRLDWTEVINFNKGIDGRSRRRAAK